MILKSTCIVGGYRNYRFWEKIYIFMGLYYSTFGKSLFKKYVLNWTRNTLLCSLQFLSLAFPRYSLSNFSHTPHSQGERLSVIGILTRVRVCVNVCRHTDKYSLMILLCSYVCNFPSDHSTLHNQ